MLAQAVSWKHVSAMQNRSKFFHKTMIIIMTKKKSFLFFEMVAS